MVVDLLFGDSTRSSKSRVVCLFTFLSRCNTSGDISTDADIITLVRACWYIDGERPPFRYGSDETLNTSRKHVLWETYHSGRPQKKFIVPALDNSDRSPVMQEVVFGREVRVGNKRFNRQKGGTWVTISTNDWDEAYWEDFVSRGDYVVRSRRKALAPQAEMLSASPAKPRVAEVDDDLSASDDDEDEPDDHLAHENFEDVVSSAEEDCAHSDPNEAYDDKSSELNSGPDGDFHTESDDVENCTDGDSDNDDTASGSSTGEEAAHAAPNPVDSAGTAQISRGDASSAEDDDLTTADEATTSNTALDNTSDTGSDADNEVSSVNSDSTTRSRPDSSPRSDLFAGYETHMCDICGLGLLRKQRRSQATVDFYGCLPCAVTRSWEVCEVCFGKGNWCRNRNHFLYMGTFSFRGKKPVFRGFIDSSRASLVTNIVVERCASGQGNSRRLVSRFTRRLSSMLHKSSPVIHPTIPLLIFPLDGRELLFMNMQDSTFFTYDIPYDPAETAETEAGTCLPLSVALHFSSCGRYLQVLRFTARSGSWHSPTRLFVILFSVSLNLDNPCSVRPKISAPGRGADLGNRTALVCQVPFEVVWTDTYAYIAVVGGASTPILRVVRFPIVAGTQDDNSEGNVHILSEDIALPSSAPFRPVYFFPATNKGVARIMLGCLHGPLSQPPVVVYLDRGNTGRWVPTRSLPVFSQTTHEHRSGASIEAPGLYDECNAITSHAIMGPNLRGKPDVITLVFPQGIQDVLRTAAQDHDMYCPSCFQLGISLPFIGAPGDIEVQRLNWTEDSLLRGTLAEDARFKWAWKTPLPTLIQALESGCQFCSLVIMLLLGDIHVDTNDLFLGPGGPRCCAIGPSPKKKSKEVRDAIKTLSSLPFDSDMPEEQGMVEFAWELMKGDGQIRSFSKMIIEVDVTNLIKNEERVMIMLGDSKIDGRPDTVVCVYDKQRMVRCRGSFVMELHSLRGEFLNSHPGLFRPSQDEM